MFSDTITGQGNSLEVEADIDDASFQDINGVNNLTVTTVRNTLLNGNIDASGTATFNSAVQVTGTSASISAGNIDFKSTLTGNSLTLTGDTDFGNTVAMTGDLTLYSGTFSSIANIGSRDLNIRSTASLALGGNALNLGGSLANDGELSEVGFADITGDLVNSNSLKMTTAIVGGNITNSGSTFEVTTIDAYGNITNTSTGNMAISTALNINGTGTSTLNLGGTVDLSTATLTLGASKNAILNNSIAVNNFAFTEVAKPKSRFTLSSGVSLDVTGSIDYKLGSASGLDVYDGNYFVTSGGGQLVQTMANGADVIYRVGNNDSTTVVTLSVPNNTEKIAVKVMDSIIIRNEVVTGIADTTRFTTVISRNWDGQGSSGAITTSLNWANALNGPGFIPSKGVLFSETGDAWDITTTSPTVTVDTDGLLGGRSWTNTYTLPHNGTYAVANIDAAMTGTYLNGNIALYEMANPDFNSMYDSFYLEVDNVSNFPIGTYPYFSASMYPTGSSVGKAIYQQMEYRLVANPLTNLLEGQVPPIGSIVGQAITEGASLTLTADAPVYLEVNGEYTIGKGWLPIGTPASAANIEQFQAPISQGQLDEFYLDFGGREGLFETPASFRSDLDEMLDDLLAG